MPIITPSNTPQDVGQVININPIDLIEDVGVGVTLPFNGTSVFNTSYTTQEQVKSNLINVLLTEPGERIYQPEFGVGLKTYLFESQINEEELEQKIKSQVDEYIEEIEIKTIELKLVSDDHTLYIRLFYEFLLNNTSDSIQLNFQ